MSLAAFKELQAAATKNRAKQAGSSSAGFLPSPRERGCGDTGGPPLPSADHTPVLAGLVAPHGLLLDVHEVAVHARPPGEWRHNAVSVPALPELLLAERLAAQYITVLQRHFAVAVRAHLIRQLGHGEERMEHEVDVGVALGRDLKVGAGLTTRQQLLDLLICDLAAQLSVALVATDDQRHVYVFFGLVFEARLGLKDLPLEALHLLEGVAVVETEHQDEDIA